MDLIKTNKIYKSSFFGDFIEKGYSDFHHYEFVNNNKYGLCLFLDGILQSTSEDQIIYHEKFVQSAIKYNSNPRNILIIGGAGGGILHSIFKFIDMNNVINIDVVDIDQKLFEISIKHMKGWNNDEFSNKKVKIFYENGVDFLLKQINNYDIIFLDVSDPLSITKSHELYTSDVYYSILNNLFDKGVLVFHGASCLMSNNPLIKTYLKENPKLVSLHHHPIFINSFEYEWMFNVIQKQHENII
jgi:spermidine synthase